MSGRNAKKIRKEVKGMYSRAFCEALEYWNQFYASLPLWEKIKMAFKKKPPFGE